MVFSEIVCTYIRPGDSAGNSPLAIQKTVVHSLMSGSFVALNSIHNDGQHSFPESRILETGSRNAATQSLPRSLLSDILNAVPFAAGSGE